MYTERERKIMKRSVVHVHRLNMNTEFTAASQTEHEHSVHSSFTDWTWTQCSQQLHRLNMNSVHSSFTDWTWTVFTAASQTEHEQCSQQLHRLNMNSVHSSFTDWTWTVFTAASQTEHEQCSQQLHRLKHQESVGHLVFIYRPLMLRTFQCILIPLKTLNKYEWPLTIHCKI